MVREMILLGLCLTTGVASVLAADPGATKATLSITGLHCPPCTRTVESSVRGVKGVRSISVDWSTKSAKVEFDEQAISAQQVASAIVGTPHMMGGGLKYGSWLSLNVPDLKDETAAKTAREALGKVPGVANVAPFVAQHTVSVQFGGEGKATTTDLIAALKKAGLDAKTY